MLLRTLALLTVAALGVPDLQAQAEPAPASLPPLLLGATLGEVASVGIGLGLAATCADQDDACGWYALSAGVIASAFTVPAGVRIGGSNRGYGRLLLGSVAGAVAGYALAELLHDAGAGNEEVLLMIPLVQISTTALLGR